MSRGVLRFSSIRTFLVRTFFVAPPSVPFYPDQIRIERLKTRLSSPCKSSSWSSGSWSPPPNQGTRPRLQGSRCNQSWELETWPVLIWSHENSIFVNKLGNMCGSIHYCYSASSDKLKIKPDSAKSHHTLYAIGILPPCELLSIY